MNPPNPNRTSIFSPVRRYEAQKSYLPAYKQTRDPGWVMRLLRSLLLAIPFGGLAFAGGLTPGNVPCTSGAAAATWITQTSYNFGTNTGGCAWTGTDFSIYFFNFTVLNAPSNPSSSVADVNNVFVTLGSQLTDGLQVNSNAFNVVSGDYARYQFDYWIDPPPPIMPGFDLDLLTETPVGGASAKVTAFACTAINSLNTFVNSVNGVPGGCQNNTTGGLYTGTVFYNSQVSGPPISTLSSSITFNQPVNFINVRLILELDARNGGTSQISGLGLAPQVVIPEPSSIALMASGLGGLLFLARRRRK
jgi:hypothetical protein